MEGLVVAATGSADDVNYGLDPAFWAGRRVQVTGHTGFKGTWLSLWLHELGAIVAGFSLPAPTSPSMFAAVGAGSLLHETIGDIRDLDGLRAAIAAFQPEIVFHLAAQAIVRRSYADPIATFSTNVQGTANVLDACRGLRGLRAVVVCTSDKCYENDERGRAFRETDRLGGRDPYSASKACAELVTAAYRASFFAPEQYDRHGVAVASARAGNVIGGGDWAADRLLPDAARAFSSRRPLVVRNPDASRPWQHVCDPVSGYLTLARALVEHGPRCATAWNFGPSNDETWQARRLAETFVRCWGEPADIVFGVGDGPDEAHVLCLDSTQATALLGWRPRLRLDEAIGETAAWYKAYYSGVSSAELLELTRSQLRMYAVAPALS